MSFWEKLCNFFKTPTIDEMEERFRQQEAENNKRLAERFKGEGLVYKQRVGGTNIWGLGDATQNFTSVLIFEDRFRFIGVRQRDVMLEDVINIEILTETQIQEKAKLGQYALIGGAALFTKPKTHEVEKTRIVINVCECGIKFPIIVETIRNTLEGAKTLNKELEEYRLKNNIDKK